MSEHVKQEQQGKDGQHGTEPDRRPAPRKKGWKPGPIQIGIFSLIFVAAIFFGVRFWLHAQHYEETDDAYVTAHSHPLSFRVNGTVADVLVDDNQLVKRGQPLARLDPRDYQVQLEQAKARLEQAQAQLAQNEAQIAQASAQQEQAAGQANVAKAKLADSQRLFERNNQLFQEGGVISRQDNDNSTFQFQQDQSSYHAATAAVRVAEANLKTAEAQRQAARAQISGAQSALQNAELQLSYTTLYAPTDGSIANKSIEAGQRVQPGQSLMAVVENYVWILANFKETQLGRIRVGQSVDISIDAIHGGRFTGRVNSFQRGSGAVFALLPPDNATGNFTKIVQRVPVKIVFDPQSIKGSEDRIVPGLSTVPAIKVQ